jgi:hypothetical protein
MHELWQGGVYEIPSNIAQEQVEKLYKYAQLNLFILFIFQKT